MLSKSKGWDFGGQADVAAKSEEKDRAASRAPSADCDIIIYQITKTGEALRTQVAGTKYWSR